MLLEEVLEVFEFLNSHPTAAEILAAVYEVKTNTGYKVKQEDFEKEFNQLPQLLGAPGPPPEGFHENFLWAEEQMEKMKKKAN